MSLSDIKDKLNIIKTKGLGEALFNTSKIDTNIINSYNIAIKRGVSVQDALAEASKNANKETMALIKSAKGGIVTTKQLTTAQKMSTLATKAQSAALKAVSVALNTLTTYAMAQVITFIISKVGELVNVYQNGIEKIKDLSSEIKGLESEQSSLNSELKETKERLYELQQIKMPTLFEKDEIEALKEYNKQLEEQIRLEKLELEQKKQAANKEAQKSYDRFFNTPVDRGMSKKDIVDDVLNTYKRYQEAYERTLAAGDKWATENNKKSLDNLKEYWADTLSNYTDELNIMLDGLDPYKDENNELIQNIKSVIQEISKLYNLDITPKTPTEIYENVDYSDVVTQLEMLAKAGELTEETFNNVKGIEKFKNALAEIGETDISEIIRAINNRIQEGKKEADNTAEGINNLSEAFKKLYDAIDDVLSKQEKLADAFKKTRLGAKLTIQEIYELIKEMPSLAPYVSKEDDGYTISAEGFEAVSKENDNIIKEQIEKDIEIVRENIALLEKEEELRAEKEKLTNQMASGNWHPDELVNQYNEVTDEYEDVSRQCQNITGSIEELKEAEKSFVLLNDLVGSSFNEMFLIVEGVNEAFDKAKTEISGYNSNIQTIDNAIKTLKDGSLLTYDEMNSLVDIAPELQDSFEQQKEGYSIVIDALEELREESYKTRNDYIDDKIAETKAEIEAAETLKKVYQDKIDQIYSWGKSAILANTDYIAELKGEISEIDEQFQPLYDTIEKLEGLRGNITSDDGDGDNLSDKLQNQIDYYKTILSAVDAVQNKYSEAIDREISALEDSKKALRDSNDERQRELDLIDARNNLENAKKRKIWVYSEGEGFKQVANEKAVKEAEEDLRNVVVDIQEAEIDKRIESLEDQKDQLEENTKALTELESEIEDAKNIAQAVNALGLSDESELLTLPDDTVEDITNKFAEAVLQKDIEDNKGNDDYVIVSMDEILQRLGAKVNAEEAFRILRGEGSQRMAHEAATKNYADALNGQFNSTILNNVNNSNPNTVTFNIYDATDPNKVAKVVNQEMTNLFTKIGNSIK